MIHPPPPRTVHVIYGPTAAGKSTFARDLVIQVKGVRFAIDEWMHAMFGADAPEKVDMAWAMPRVSRCQAQIWSVAQQILATGTDVVLESGLLRRADRSAAKARIEQAGYACAFYFVDADLAIRRQRVLHRNAEKGATYSFEITPPMFDAMESFFERPSESELLTSRLVQGAQERVAP